LHLPDADRGKYKNGAFETAAFRVPRQKAIMTSDESKFGPGREPHANVGVDAAVASDATLVQDSAGIERSLEISRRTEQPPANVPGYTVLRCLGEGAFGSVWLARENNTGKQVAVKFYTHRRGLDWSLLNREVEKLAVLYTSRHIVRLLDVGWDSDPPYYVMEYLDNGSLSSFLADGPIPPHEAVRICRSILQALVHAHGSGILHCDLKPANVLIDAEFEARLCDFGQSRLSDEQKPSLGTLFYMAPEQADLKAVPDARWDVYALGTLMYHMLCGAPPYRTPENEALIRSTDSLEERLAVYRRIVRHSPRPTEHRRVRGVDKPLAEIVDRCLHLNVEKRFPNAQAVLDALDLREHQRSRRPMMALGVVGPAVLLLAMAPIIYLAFQNAEQKARESLTQRALEADAQAAGILAGSVEHEVRRRQRELEAVAEDATLRAVLSRLDQAGWEAQGSIAEMNEEFDRRRAAIVESNDDGNRVADLVAELEWARARIARQLDDRRELADLLEGNRKRNDQRLKDLGVETDASWFVDDAKGFQRWRSPLDEKTIDKDYSWRDYFHGRGFHYDRTEVPADIAPLEHPYIAVPILSEASNGYAVPISVPIWCLEDDPAKRRVIGVLALTVSLGQLLADYGENIRTENRLIALADQRTGELLDHPWITQDKLATLLRETDSKSDERAHASGAGPGDFGTAEGGPKRRGGGLPVLRLFDSTRARFDTDDREVVRDDSYRDPVGRLDPQNYGGQWLAAFAPVGETGWTVIVQERKGSALAPVGELRAETIRFGVIALVVSCALIGLLWYFVLRALDDRVHRVGPWRSNGVRTESGGSLSTVSHK
jgi:hypothetical protein